jgi:AcrR family transcriptional regulator
MTAAVSLGGHPDWRPLPRGASALDPDQAAALQRERMLTAVASVVADRGYGTTTVADITDCARVSRRTFYEQFTDKRDCFLAAYRQGSARHFAAVRAAAADAQGWQDQLVEGTQCYLLALAQTPESARAFLVEIAAAGPEALAERAQVHARYARLLRALHLGSVGTSAVLPDGVYDAAVAAITELAAGVIRNGAAARLSELLPLVLYTEFSLFGEADIAASWLNRDRWTSHLTGQPG